MGLRPVSESHRQLFREIVEVPLPNPIPERFSIERLHGVGTYVCALVHYPDATNFEGRKIIVFEDTTEDALQEVTALDPHFAEEGNIIARFRPDEQGWQDALWLAEYRDARS